MLIINIINNYYFDYINKLMFLTWHCWFFCFSNARVQTLVRDHSPFTILLVVLQQRTGWR